MTFAWDDFEARTVWRFSGFELSYGDFPGTISAFLYVIEDAVDEFISEVIDVFAFVIASLFGFGTVEYRAPEIPRVVQSPKPVRRYVFRSKALHGSIAILAPPKRPKGPGQKMSP